MPIISTIGNNDLLNHYQAPGNDTQKQLLYGDLFEIFFENVTANHNNPLLETQRASYLTGGYFRYDLKENVTVLSLNSILMNSKNSQQEKESVQ